MDSNEHRYTTTLDTEHLHGLLLLYLALAYGADYDLDASERAAIVQLAGGWVPEVAPALLRTTVDAAVEVARDGGVLSVEGLALGLKPSLSREVRRRILADLRQVAEADGRLRAAETHVIERVRAVWEA